LWFHNIGAKICRTMEVSKSLVKNPYKSEKSGKKYLITNCSGEYCFLTENDMAAFTTGNYSEISCINELQSRFFICPENEQKWVTEHLNQRRKIKQSYLCDTELLLMVVPTLFCNSTCIYCQVSSINTDRRNKSMSFKTLSEFCCFVSRLSYKRIKIEFQGGEPTLELTSVQLIVKTLLRIRTIDFSFVICTNLLDIDADFIKFVKKYNVCISTSIDGPQSIHDFHRPALRQASSFISVTKNIGKLRDAGIYPAALMTLTSYSIDHIIDIINQYVQLGFESIFIRPLNIFGRAAENNKLYIPDQTFLDAYKKALDYLITLNLESTNIKDELTSILLRKILTPFDDGFTDLQDPCAYGSMSLLVNYNGNVYPCDEARMLAEMGNDSWRIGNIFDKEIIQEIHTFQNVIEECELSKIPMCKDCVFKYYCGADPIRLSLRNESDYCGIRKGVFKTIFDRIASNDPRVINLFNRWARY